MMVMELLGLSPLFFIDEALFSHNHRIRELMI